MNEKWKEVEGYEGYYEISNHGRIRSLHRTVEMASGELKVFHGKLLKANFCSQGYLKVNLYINRKKKTHRIHSLVAQHFINNPNGFTHVIFKDRNHTHVHEANLQWVSDKESDSRGSISNKTRRGIAL